MCAYRLTVEIEFICHDFSYESFTVSSFIFLRQTLQFNSLIKAINATTDTMNIMKDIYAK